MSLLQSIAVLHISELLIYLESKVASSFLRIIKKLMILYTIINWHIFIIRIQPFEHLSSVILWWSITAVIATNSDFLITISLEPNVADLRYFKLWILLDQIIWVWNIKGLQHQVLKILRFKYLILFQSLNSFKTRFHALLLCILLCEIGYSRPHWGNLMKRFTYFSSFQNVSVEYFREILVSKQY